jgi:hypothetical protein
MVDKKQHFDSFCFQKNKTRGALPYVLVDFHVLFNKQCTKLSENNIQIIKNIYREHSFVFINNRSYSCKETVQNQFNLMLDIVKNHFSTNTYASIIVHVDGYYKLPYDGFMKICNGTLKIDSFKDYVCKDYQTDRMFCYNERINSLSIKNNMLQRNQNQINDQNGFMSHCINVENLINIINNLTNTLILTVGPPGSGKTTFNEKLKGKKMRYIRNFISNKKVRENVSTYVDNKSSDNNENLIIDNPNASICDRTMFIKCCSLIGMKCVCIFFNITKNECCYNNNYIFNLNQGLIPIKCGKGISRYFNRLQVPKLSEGIECIHHLKTDNVKKNTHKLY